MPNTLVCYRHALTLAKALDERHELAAASKALDAADRLDVALVKAALEDYASSLFNAIILVAASVYINCLDSSLSATLGY